MAKPPILSYEDIRRIAESFLEQYWPSGAIPVDVERIVDARLGIDIVPMSNLQAKIGVDGFLSRDRRTIYVDEYVYFNVPSRCRFTLAHEAAHWHLHQELYRDATFTSPEEWADFLASIPGEDYRWYEYQAYAFAGIVLAPTAPLRSAIESKVASSAGSRIPLDLSIDVHRDVIARAVAQDFSVSDDVILKRGRKDGFWD